MACRGPCIVSCRDAEWSYAQYRGFCLRWVLLWRVDCKCCASQQLRFCACLQVSLLSYTSTLPSPKMLQQLQPRLQTAVPSAFCALHTQQAHRLTLRKTKETLKYSFARGLKVFAPPNGLHPDRPSRSRCGYYGNNCYIGIAMAITILVTLLATVKISLIKGPLTVDVGVALVV